MLNMIHNVGLNVRVIVTSLATETHSVVEDVRLPGRGFVIHRKITRAFPAAYQTGDTILIHPEIEQQMRNDLATSVERQFDATFLGGENARIS